jgi:hypothetical protein
MPAEATTNGRTIDERWLTARAVAHKLGCTRLEVYKLEKRGKLLGHDVKEHGAKLRRFDPASVRALAEAAEEIEQILDDESEADDDDETVANPNSMALAAKVVAESRQLALDARKGQQEAFALVTKPSREFTEVLLKALDQRETRIAELETKLSKYYDEQREARADDRETAMMQSRLEREDARKDQMFKTFTDNLPLFLDQVKASISGAAGGPFSEWIRKLSPEKQAKLIMAIESVTGDDEEPPSAEKAINAS